MIAIPSRRALLLAGASLTFMAAAPGAHAADSLTFAWSPAPQTPQIDLAIAEKAFERAGLDVTVVVFPTGREAFEALTGGQADLASMAELPAVIGALRGQDFGVVADLARYKGSRIITTPVGRVAVRLGTIVDREIPF